MAVNGGSGTLDTPAEGENVARIIPLRHRTGTSGTPARSRGPLQRERAAFDPELEDGEVVLRRPLRRRVAASITHRESSPGGTHSRRLALLLPLTLIAIGLAAWTATHGGARRTRARHDFAATVAGYQRRAIGDVSAQLVSVAHAKGMLSATRGRTRPARAPQANGHPPRNARRGHDARSGARTPDTTVHRDSQVTAAAGGGGTAATHIASATPASVSSAPSAGATQENPNPSPSSSTSQPAGPSTTSPLGGLGSCVQGC
jgi:hypothetical protein